LLNVVNSGTAAVTYTRRKIVVWGLALPFAVAMILLPPVGEWLNFELPTKPPIAILPSPPQPRRP